MSLGGQDISQILQSGPTPNPRVPDPFQGGERFGLQSTPFTLDQLFGGNTLGPPQGMFGGANPFSGPGGFQGRGIVDFLPGGQGGGGRLAGRRMF